ncbi:MAG: hypothetical protein ACRD4D_06515 [Candidatus Acidiferrales bacterium]
MRKEFLRLAGAVLALLLAATLGAGPARAQGVKDLVVNVVYLSVKPEASESWTLTFKKHFEPALNELREQGTLAGWHLFVPGLHHPGNAWTHALVIASKDRAAQGAMEKKIREVFAAIPAAEAQKFFGAADPAKHFDDEWRELDLSGVKVPEEKKDDAKPEETKK